LENFIETVIAIAVGGLIIFWAARHYYVKASKELERAAARLERLTTLIIRGLEEVRKAGTNTSRGRQTFEMLT
jgi:hypothetical protein